MPRKSEWGRKIGTGPMRNFVVTYEDDPPERVEAVNFFANVSLAMCHFPALPRQIDTMSEIEAQKYLDSHPQKEQWSDLHIRATAQVGDLDLHRLAQLPELKRVILYGFGNDALGHLRHLNQIVELTVYSDLIDNSCLNHVSRLDSLLIIDFQGSSNITPAAYSSVVSRLPNIVKSYPPHANRN